MNTLSTLFVILAFLGTAGCMKSEFDPQNYNRQGPQYQSERDYSQTHYDRDREQYLKERKTK